MPIRIKLMYWGSHINLTKTEGYKCFVSDIILSSSHGPKEYNENPYSILGYPSIMVTSFDHDNYG